MDDARRAFGAWTIAAEAREQIETDATLEAFRREGQAGMPEERLIPPGGSDQPSSPQPTSRRPTGTGSPWPA